MKTKIDIQNLNVSIAGKRMVQNVSLSVHEHEILAIIGPSQSGKAQFLRAVNRMLDLNEQAHVEGSITIDNRNIYSPSADVNELRKKVGMIFPLPMPLPMSIFDNLAYGPRLHGTTDPKKLITIVETSLKAASLWDEVRERLDMSAMKLSGGQQQRLCIARTLTVTPDIILFDQPCSGLDPISTAKVEATMRQLIKKYTIILVTNIMKQAERVSDRTAFFYNGELIEIGKTKNVFQHPKNKKTQDYISGKFG